MRVVAALLLVLTAAPTAADPAARRPAGAARGRGTCAPRGCPAGGGAGARGAGRRPPAGRGEPGPPPRPADLRYPARFKSGAEPADVYRTLVTGLDGTPMLSY